MADAQSRPVLELRVHGVNNTPPTAMLDLPAEALTVRGDALGGFWSPRSSALAGLTAGQRGYVPPGVTREAYSWGGLARTNPAAVRAGVGGALVAAGARIGWILLMPFGLANVAFWARLAPEPPDLETSGRRTLRVFALVLTLVFTLTLVAVVVDMLAIQCLSSAGTCPVLPSFVDVARGWPEGRRVAVALVVVLLALGGLSLLSLSSNVRYEVPESLPTSGPTSSGAADVATPPPLLAQPGFWARSDDKRRLLWVHMSAAAAVAVLVVAVDWNARQAFRLAGEPLAPLGTGPRLLWGLAALAAGYVLVLVLRHLLTPERSAIALSGRVRATTEVGPGLRVAAGIAVLAAVTALVLQTPQARDRGALPVMATSGPALLAAVSVGLWLALSALGFSRPGPRWQAGATVLGALLVLVVMAAGRRGYLLGLAVGAIVVVVLVVLHLTWGAEHRAQAFQGRATAILMLLALGFGVLLSSALTLVTGDWLNGCYSASDLAAIGRTEPCPVTGTDRVAATDVTAPAVLHAAGALVLPCLVLGLLVVAAWLVRNRALAPDPAPRRPGLPADPAVLVAARARARRTATLLGRAEGLVGLLGAVVLANLVLAVAIATPAELIPEFAFGRAAAEVPGPVNSLLAVGSVGAALVAVTLVGLLLGGGSPGGSRPLGLLWDLVCFLPRDGHPLSPPCYAERAVPEVVGRLRQWLGGTDLPPERSPEQLERTVVLSGHSLGGVVCVAALLQLEQPSETARLSLVTYGSQLQAYFSRLFPQLLGPTVLGVPPIGAPPFWDAARRPVRGDLRAPGGCVRDRLTGPVGGSPRWRSLWRATDPLGFPVDDGRVGPVDVGAAEVDLSGYLPALATHSDYPRTPDYAAVLADLVPGPTTGPAGSEPPG